MDLSALLNTPTAGPLSTAVKACKEGDFRAVLDDGEKWLQWRDGDSTRNLSPQVVFLWSILDEGVRKELGRDKVIVPQNIWLDTTESGQLDTAEGKNVQLGRLLDVAGLNNGSGTLGERIQKLRGAGPFTVKVGQRADKNDPTVKYAEVRRVSKLA